MKTKSRERYSLIDGIRGLAVVNMVAYHFLFDLFVSFQLKPDWYRNPAVSFWQQWVCGTFILISGMTWNMGKNHLKRGLLLNLLGAGITLATCLIQPKAAVFFGILTFLGCACLLLIPLERILKRIPAAVGMVLFFCLFLLTRHTAAGYVGMGDWRLQLPPVLYEIKPFSALGFPYDGFFSADYFPLFPWIFLYLTGYFGYGILKKNSRLRQAALTPLPLFTAVGQKSLLIYVVHQPILMALAAAAAHVLYP